MAAALARDGEVILASVIEVTGDAALTSAQPEARARRRLLDTLAADMGATHARSLVTVARVGTDLARAHDGAVTLLHVTERGRRRATLYELLGDLAYDERAERLVTRAGDPPKIIIEEIAAHDAIVFGATGREGAEDPLGPV